MLKKLFAMVLLAALSIGATAQAQGLLGAEEDQYVKPKLVADVSSIEPGQTFRLGMLFTMEPEWHIYWQFPGDAGQAPILNWHLPAGFTAGPIQWPVPERMTLGDIVGYGYNEEALLFATVTAPANITEKQIEISAEPEWLACKQECVPGEAKGENAPKLTIQVGARKDSPEKALFDKYQALVPSPDTNTLSLKYDGPATIDAGTSASATITVTLPADAKIDAAEVSAKPGSLDLFPIFSEPWKSEGSRASKPTLTADGAQFTFVFTARPDAQSTTTPIRIVARAPLAGPEKKVAIGEFELPLMVTAASAASTTAQPAKTEQVSNAAAAENIPAPGQPIFSFLSAKDKVDTSLTMLLKMLFFAFVGGLILNVMPCVLPVLSLKVMSFVRQSGEEPGRIWRLGIMFAVGVLTSFVILALVLIGLKEASQTVGWGFQMQEPRFVIVMTAVIVALSLSLLGVYEIGLPGSAAGSMDKVSRKEGYGGAFFNGVLVTALATPCTAPMLGAALGFAFTQKDPVILLFFVAIALGLAAPYVLLSANPRLIKWMPKPGAWMNTFKQFMGFIMMATAVWLLWILGGQVGADGVIVTLAFMLLIGLACWLFGMAYDWDTKPARRRLYTTLAIALVISGYWYFPERYLDKFSTMSENAPGKEVASTGNIQWEPFSFARVEELVGQKKLVFLDLTADWCTTCKVNEGGVLSSDRIREAFQKYSVVPVRGDYTRRDKRIAAVLSYFGQGGVPVYIIFPPERPKDYILLSQILTIGQVEDALAKASK